MAVWLIIISISSLMLLVIMARTLRRLRPTRGDATSYDLSIEQLVRLHRSGEIDAEQFERARAEVLARRSVEPVDPTTRGFEVLPPRCAAIQSLEDRAMP